MNGTSERRHALSRHDLSVPTSTEISEFVLAACQEVVEEIAAFASGSSADAVGAALTQLRPDFGAVPNEGGAVAWDWVLRLLGYQLLAVSRAHAAAGDDFSVPWADVGEQWRIAEDILRGCRGRAAQLGL